MNRTILDDLDRWKVSAHRKPLLLKGLRQVGKTWALKAFGATRYEDVAYFNFEERPELAELFASTKEPARIIGNLSMLHGRPIRPEATLLIFDEIQECNAALNALKYFSEDANQYHLACAGSLLGVTLSRPASFPVGKVDFLTLHPMSFIEFLEGNGDRALLDYLLAIDRIGDIPEIFFNPLEEKLKWFFVTGGMPEAIDAWVSDRDAGRVQAVLSDLLDACLLDFSKHAKPAVVPRIAALWKSLPSQLARENKKFVYGVVKPGARAREYEDALAWLETAGLVHRVFRCAKPGMPMSAYRDLSAFKLYAADVGLLRRLANLSPDAFGDAGRLFTEFKGALSENYVLQSLARMEGDPPYYWSSGGQAEVDFLIQRGDAILPVEVKSDRNLRSRSLSVYGAAYAAETPLKIRFSLKNLRRDGDILNIPLFMVDLLDRILALDSGR